jgi:hypothetical protein
MDTVEFWGIVFRSGSHMCWFQMSMIMLAFGLTWCLIVLITAKKLPNKVSAQDILLPFLLFHIYTSTSAVLVIAGRFFMDMPINGRVYSTDCIWFNAIMVVIYFFLRRFCKYLTTKRGREGAGGSTNQAKV